MNSQPVQTRWEYSVTSLMGEDMMNAYGGRGWELVSVNDGRLYWKRPITARKPGALDER